MLQFVQVLLALGCSELIHLEQSRFPNLESRKTELNYNLTACLLNNLTNFSKRELLTKISQNGKLSEWLERSSVKSDKT